MNHLCFVSFAGFESAADITLFVSSNPSDFGLCSEHAFLLLSFLLALELIGFKIEFFLFIFLFLLELLRIDQSFGLQNLVILLAARLRKGRRLLIIRNTVDLHVFLVKNN